jgi:transposase
MEVIIMSQGVLNLGDTPTSRSHRNHIERLESSGRCLVTVNCIPVYDYDLNDGVSNKYVAIMLYTKKLALQADVAKLWGVSKKTLYLWSQKFATDGIAGLQADDRGRPPLSDEVIKQVHSLRQAGVKKDEIARRLNIGRGTVDTIIYSNRKVQPELFPASTEDEPGAVPDADEEPLQDAAEEAELTELQPVSSDPLDRKMDRMAAVLGLIDDAEPMFADCDHVEGAGALLAVAMLSKDPFLDKVKAAYSTIGPAFYGLRTIFVTLFMMAVLRIKNPEKNGKRNPLKLGRILGLDRGPSTKTIRRKIRTLSGREKALDVMRSLGEERLAETGIPDAVLYVDGHVKCYYGNGSVGKTFSTAKNRVVKGETDYWVNLGDGTPILCLPTELNDKMSTMLLRVIKDAKKICGSRRITVIFDRGGSSAATYEKIIKAGCDFIAYHKNPKELKASEFPLGPTLVNGNVCAQVPVSRHIDLEVRHRSGEGKYKPSGRQITVREVILLRDNDGRQTSVVTSREDLTNEQVLEAIFIRWSQENCFKYLLKEYAFDHLCVYGTEELREEHDKPNPEYVKLEKKISNLRSKLANDLSLPLEKLAEELAEGSLDKMGTILTAKRKATLQNHIDRIEELKKLKSSLPERIKPESYRRLPQESRMVMNLVKMTAYIIEGKLASILRQLHSGINGNERGLCSGFLQSTGALRVCGETLHVTIEPQGDPQRTRLLAALCDQVNALEAVYPGTSLTMHFSAETGNQE